MAAGRPPARVEAAASVATSWVDAPFSGWLDLDDGFAAAIECSFDDPERQSLEIAGTAAAVLVERALTPGPDDVALTLRRRARAGHQPGALCAVHDDCARAAIAKIQARMK